MSLYYDFSSVKSLHGFQFNSMLGICSETNLVDVAELLLFGRTKGDTALMWQECVSV